MSEEFPHRRSGADFGFDILERTVPYRQPNRSLLGLATPAADTRSPADSRLPPAVPVAEPAAAEALSYGQSAAARTVSAPARDREAAAPPVTLEKVGDFLELDFRRLFVWLKAGLMAALLLALAGALAGGAYGLLAKKRYTAATDVLINPANLQVIDNDLFPQASQVDGQVLATRSKQRVLTSRNVLARVVDDLDLTNDPEFGSATHASGGAAPDLKLSTLAALQESVKTEADDQSFVTTLLVSAETPAKAVEISQAIVAAFQKELAQTDAEGAGRAAAALDARLRQLKADVLDAENKVAAYRRDHNLSSSNGQLVSSQAMTQLNTQIVTARASAAAAQANYDTLVADGVNGTSTGPAVSQTLADLRSKANQARQDFNSQSVMLGPRHPSILKLKVELDTVNAQVKAEYQHTVGVAKANRDAAKAALDSLEAQMSSLQGNVFADGESEVALRELERDAASRTAIYESFLSRARQITEREQIDTTNVQVISEPVPPKGRSWPPSTKLLVALGAFAGFALGLLLAVARGIRQDLRAPLDDRRGNPA